MSTFEEFTARFVGLNEQQTNNRLREIFDYMVNITREKEQLARVMLEQKINFAAAEQKSLLVEEQVNNHLVEIGLRMSSGGKISHDT
jgi:hypothetical protein